MSFRKYKRLLESTLKNSSDVRELHEKLRMQLEKFENHFNQSPQNKEELRRIQNETDRLVAEFGSNWTEMISKTVPKIPHDNSSSVKKTPS